MRTQGHWVTFMRLNAAEVEAVALAMLGKSNKAIQEATGLSTCQITYRLAKAKGRDGLPRGVGYRTQYRDELPPQSEVDPLKRDVVRRLANKFAHPVRFAGEKIAV